MSQYSYEFLLQNLYISVSAPHGAIYSVVYICPLEDRMQAEFSVTLSGMKIPLFVTLNTFLPKLTPEQRYQGCG